MCMEETGIKDLEHGLSILLTSFRPMVLRAAQMIYTNNLPVSDATPSSQTITVKLDSRKLQLSQLQTLTAKAPKGMGQVKASKAQASRLIG